MFESKALKEIQNYCDIGWVIPQSILDEFTKFNFLYEKS